MAEHWFTYSELGERLQISPEAARQKAIRNHWPRRPGNDGKAQVRVDIEEVIASTPPRPPRDDALADARPTPDEPAVEQPVDARALTALEEHITTLKAMVAKADELTERERERADREAVRADTERARADAERDRAGEARARAEALAARLDALRGEGGEKRAALERDLSELRALVDGLQRRSWWRRLAG